MQTKSNRIRPPECKHVLFPRCGCQPPTPESVNPSVVAAGTAKVTSTVKAVDPKTGTAKKRGRPKTPWAVRTDPAQDFLDRLPAIMLNPVMRDRLQKMVMAEECRRSLSKFCREAWPVVEPSTKLEWNWHHELLCSVLQGVQEEWEHAKSDRKFRMRLNNLLINVPPGTGKSRLLSCFFPVWCWIREPGMRFLCVSVNEDASLRDARDAKLLITCDWFQETFQPDWHLKGDQDAISNFGTTRGGVRISKGQGGAVIGLRSDCFAGDTLVATEHGDIPIRDLHEMLVRPRVWSMNHQTNELELAEIQASRRIASRPVVEVCTESGNRVRCTDDHRFWTGEAYEEAAGLAGREVPAVRWADVRRVPHGAPQVQGTTVLSVVAPLGRDGREKVDVYDIQVAGNHNFLVRSIRTAEYLTVHNCLIVDDANDPTEVESKVKRDGVNVNWKDTLYNRVNHMERSVRIGIQQRTHEEDWSGFVLKQQGVWDAEKNPKGWLHVCLPAEFEPDRRCVTPWGQDPRTVKGESLHWGTPADVVAKMKRAVPNHAIDEQLGGLSAEDMAEESGRLSPESLLSERLRLGANKYSGLMQQRPTAAEGGTIKLLWWRFFQYDETPLVPERRDRFSRDLEMDTAYPTLVVGKKGTYYPVWDFDWTCVSIDCASKRTERGSQYGILVISGKGNKRFVRDDKTRRGDILEILKVVKDLCREYAPQKILIEAKAAGNDLATLFHQEFQAGKIVGPNGKSLVVRVEEVDPNNAGKEARLDACLPELEAGLVYVQERAMWLDPFIGEVCGFPLATHDDRVDSLSQCLNWYRGKGNYQLPTWK